jgi:hypothetical protein
MSQNVHIKAFTSLYAESLEDSKQLLRDNTHFLQPKIFNTEEKEPSLLTLRCDVFKAKRSAYPLIHFFRFFKVKSETEIDWLRRLP